MDIEDFPKFPEKEGNEERFDQVFSHFHTFLAKGKENFAVLSADAIIFSFPGYDDS